MEITDVVDQAFGLIALAAVVGLVLLLPLYLSQRRDLRRLVEWMERDLEHPAQDIASSEMILDRAEVELEERLGVEAPPQEPEPSPVAQRVTSERPALERVTMEREALIPHPRWRHFVSRITQPRWLAALAAAAVLLAVAAIFGSQLVLETDGERERPAARIESSGTTVAVLNGTTVAGLGAKVGDDVEANDFTLGAVSTFPESVEQTVILFEPDAERAARRLSAKLGGIPLQPIDRRAQRLAEGADVVVVAGQDRATGR